MCGSYDSEKRNQIIPWTPDDAKRHTHLADTPKRKRMWSDVANSQLKEHSGEERAEEIAVRSANAAVADDHKHSKSLFYDNLRYLLKGSG